LIACSSWREVYKLERAQGFGHALETLASQANGYHAGILRESPSTMPTFYVSFTAEQPATYPPVATMIAVESGSPQAAVEALLATGRVPQIPGLKWANVAIEVHSNGVPARVMRFAIHAENGSAVD
jgi:hypothetical protein